MSDSRSLTHTSFAENVYVRLFQIEWFAVTPQGWALNQQRDTFWRLYFHPSDGAFAHTPQGRCDFQAECLYFIPAGVQFSTGATQTVPQFYAHFDVLGLHDIVMRELFDRMICLPDQGDLGCEVGQLAQQVRDGASDDLALHLQLKGIIYQALARYLKAVPAEQIEHCRAIAASLEPVLPAIRHIEHHLAQNISNQTLAQLCFMSESYFIRRFRECVGQTPNQYLREQRIKSAAQQLLFSQQSIDQIATATGFGSRFYLTRVFTQHTGVSPAAYRKLTWT
jgi:AraC-like DNA-binding protein